MERASTKLRLSNPLNLGIEPIEVSTIADTNTLMLCIPEHIAIQLDLQTQSTREVSVAEGRRLSVPYVGPLRVDFENRFCFVGALVLGDEILLGAVPMEDMDLIVQSSLRKVTVNPSSPNVPHARVK
jgi:clan AA aspartic protease